MSGADPKVVELYRRLEVIVRSCGPVTLTPTKDRIRFRALVQFAGVVIQRNRLRVGFILSRRLENPRISKILSFTPGRFSHAVYIRTLEDLDNELKGWLREAYEVGRTRRPAKPAR